VEMTVEQRLWAVLDKALADDRLANEIKDQIRDLLKPENLGLFIGMMALSAAAQATPAGWIADLLGVVLLGKQVLDIGEQLETAVGQVLSATNRAGLDLAAGALVIALAAIGILAGLALAGKRLGKMLDERQAARAAENKVVPAATPTDPATPPVVSGAPVLLEPGSIGLGLEDTLSGLRGLGATTYKSWFEKGLTKIRWLEQAWDSPYYFERSFIDAATNAPHIAFDLTDLDVPRALASGGKFVSKNYTNAELYRIVNNREWLNKTTFLENGTEVKPVFREGKVVGFAR